MNPTLISSSFNKHGVLLHYCGLDAPTSLIPRVLSLPLVQDGENTQTQGPESCPIHLHVPSDVYSGDSGSANVC